jgi:hypothetical protein
MFRDIGNTLNAPELGCPDSIVTPVGEAEAGNAEEQPGKE